MPETEATQQLSTVEPSNDVEFIKESVVESNSGWTQLFNDFFD